MAWTVKASATTTAMASASRRVRPPHRATASSPPASSASSTSATEYTCQASGSRGTPSKTALPGWWARNEAENWWLQGRNSDSSRISAATVISQSATVSRRALLTAAAVYAPTMTREVMDAVAPDP